MILTLTDSSFDDYWSSSEAKLLVLDCWSSRVESCRLNAAVIEFTAQSLAGVVDIAKVNVEQNPRIVAKYSISVIPSIAIVSARTLIHFFHGVPSSELLSETLKQILSGNKL